jgi:hypothetical protein
MPEPEESRPREELFYLPLDPFEAHNLAGKPEVEHVRGEMATRLEKFMRKTKDPLCQGVIAAAPYLDPEN